MDFLLHYYISFHEKNQRRVQGKKEKNYLRLYVTIHTILAKKFVILIEVKAGFQFLEFFTSKMKGQFYLNILLELFDFLLNYYFFNIGCRYNQEPKVCVRLYGRYNKMNQTHLVIFVGRPSKQMKWPLTKLACVKAEHIGSNPSAHPDMSTYYGQDMPAWTK